MRENVGNWLLSWYTQCAIFPLKKSPNFAVQRHYHLIGESSTAATAVVASVYAYPLLLVASLCYRRTILRSFSFFLLSYIHLIYIYIDWTLLVPSTREWRRTRICTYILSYDKYCTTIDLFLVYYIIDKLYWWTYTYIRSWLSLSKHTDHGHN